MNNYSTSSTQDTHICFPRVVRSRLLGGVSPEYQWALRDYGMNLGIAFQLADDALDLTATKMSLERQPELDLIEGKLTLPMILLMKRDPVSVNY
jgi:octaprenyl-diphosphate synthase